MALIDELKEVRQECEAEMAGILNSSDEELIQRDLKAYEENLRTTYAGKKAEALKEKELEIRAIDNLIAREAKKQETAQAEKTVLDSAACADSYYAGM